MKMLQRNRIKLQRNKENLNGTETEPEVLV